MNKVLSVAAGLAATLYLASTAEAFDTGPHANITEQAMAMQGFNRPAADVVQVENWLTDYYTSRPFFGSSDQCALEKLHFDDVFNPTDVEAYWNTLLRNTVNAADQARANNDVLGFYAVLGVSLHVVQDFYTHSNWVETSGVLSGASYDTTSYFQWRQSGRARQAVYTGWYDNCLKYPQDGHPPHGGYTSGMNHDSVVRPNYNRAYVYAVAASNEWLEAIKNALALKPGGLAFWNNALTYSPSSSDAGKLALDQQASLYVSEWIENPLNVASLDGHWNGNRSGYAGAFTAFIAAWTALPDSPYVAAFKQKKPYLPLSQGLYAPYVGPTPSINPFPLSGKVVRMLTPRVDANYAVGTESYFGRVIPTQPGLPDYPIRDASLYHLPRTNAPWQYIIFLTPNMQGVTWRYTLWNEYGLPGPGQTAVPIHGSATDVTFACSISCSWGDTGKPMQPMPASLNLQGSGFTGVELKGITIQVSQASPI